MGKLDENGHEIPDSRPLAVPVGFERPETLAEQVQRLVRGGLSRAAEADGFESFEDAEDFDIDDEPDDPSTIYETHFDPILGREVTADEFRRNEDYYRKEYAKATDEQLKPQLDLDDFIEKLRADHAPAPTAAEKPPEGPAENE